MLLKDDWVKAAMADDNVVAELLVRLKQAHALAPIKSTVAAHGLPPPRWGVRQLRTRMSFRYDVASPAKGGDSRRNSPTTPLSWGAGTSSSSGTADGSDDSDLRGYGFFRSKGIVLNDSRVPSAATTLNNKPKRKKSFDRLTEEETLMLSGRTQLKEDKLKDQGGRNKKLKKRMKQQLDFTAEIHRSTATAALPYSGLSTLHQQHEEEALDLEPSKKQEKIGGGGRGRGRGFMLPDLNEPYSLRNDDLI